jgi:ribosomal protein L37E
MLLSHEQQYQAAWADLRLRGHIWLAVTLGFVPGVPLLTAAIETIFRVDAFFWIGIAWMATFVGAAWHRTTFPCPRCGRAFFFNWFQNPFARRCMHCGLPIGAAYDARRISD